MNPTRVLIAEDDPVIRSMIAELLTEEGMSVVEVGSGDEALKSLADGGFDLVITDVVMPSPYGIQVAAIARTAGEGVPILVITAHREQWIPEAIDRLDGTEILHKPFSSEELLKRVHGLLDAAADARLSNAAAV